MPVVVQNVSELLWREQDKPPTCSFPPITILKEIYHKKIKIKMGCKTIFTWGILSKPLYNEGGSALVVLIL